MSGAGYSQSLGGATVSWVFTHVRTCQSAHLKRNSFTVVQLQLNKAVKTRTSKKACNKIQIPGRYRRTTVSRGIQESGAERGQQLCCERET